MSLFHDSKNVKKLLGNGLLVKGYLFCKKESIKNLSDEIHLKDSSLINYYCNYFQSES